MHIRNLQPTDLEYFLEICRCGSIAQATALLGVTQPALSKSIRRLELVAGAKLLDRTPRGVTPTQMGRFLLERASLILSELESTKHTLQEMSGVRTGTISFGVAPTLNHRFIPEVASQALQQRPGLHFQINEGLFQSLLPQLQLGELDFIISSPLQMDSLPADLVCEPLGKNLFVACVGSDHPLAGRQHIEDAELDQFSWVLVSPRGILRKVLSELFNSRQLVPPKPSIETSSTVLIKALLTQHNFIGFLPLEVFATEEQNGSIQRLSVPWLSWERELWILSRGLRTLSPAAQFTLDLIRSHAQQHAIS